MLLLISSDLSKILRLLKFHKKYLYELIRWHLCELKVTFRYDTLNDITKTPLTNVENLLVFSFVSLQAVREDPEVGYSLLCSYICIYIGIYIYSVAFLRICTGLTLTRGNLSLKKIPGRTPDYSFWTLRWCKLSDFPEAHMNLYSVFLPSEWRYFFLFFMCKSINLSYLAVRCKYTVCTAEPFMLIHCTQQWVWVRWS